MDGLKQNARFSIQPWAGKAIPPLGVTCLAFSWNPKSRESLFVFFFGGVFFSSRFWWFPTGLHVDNRFGQ